MAGRLLVVIRLPDVPADELARRWAKYQHTFDRFEVEVWAEQFCLVVEPDAEWLFADDIDAAMALQAELRLLASTDETVAVSPLESVVQAVQEWVRVSEHELRRCGRSG